jgi:hypothetical protein
MKKIFNTLILISFLTIQNGFAFDFDTNNYQPPPPVYGRIAIGDLNGDGLDDLYYSGYVLRHYTGGILTPPGTYEYFPAGVLLNNAKGQLIDQNQENVLLIDALNWDSMFYNGGDDYYSVNVKMADLDNDGDNDIINSKGHILLNDGNGQLSALLTINIPESNNPIFPVDIDNDGVVELIYNYGIYSRATLVPLNYDLQINSQGLWQEHQQIKLDDFNNDGFKDIIVFGDESPVSLLINDGQGNFPVSLRVSLPNIESFGLAVGDIDNDNDVDIILSDGTILQNNLNLDFTAIENGINFTMVGSIESIYPQQFVNFNGDEFLDILVSIKYYEYNDIEQYVLINDGNGRFSIERGKTSYIASNHRQVLPAKLNFDDYTDFITPYKMLNTESYDGNGSLLSTTSHNILYNSQQNRVQKSGLSQLPFLKASLVDLDSDGHQEILFNKSDFPTYFDGEEYYSSPPEQRMFYLSNIKKNNYTEEPLPSFSCGGEKYLPKTAVSADFNKDGYNDLLVGYYTNSHVCENFAENKIFFNSEEGFNQENSLDLAVDGVNASYFNRYESHFYSANDFNGDGFIDVFSSRGVLINKGDNTFFNVESDNISYYGNYPITDLNSDGVSEIIYNDIIHQIKADNTIQETPIETRYGGQFTFFDYNKDGLDDMFAYIPNRNTIEQYENIGNFNFTLKKSFRYFIDAPLSHVNVVDIDNDGILEVLAIENNSVLNIYQLVEDRINFVKTLEEHIVSNIQDPNLGYAGGILYNDIVFNDFDGDNKLDIYFAGKIYYYRDFSFLPGLNYDPNNNGHGFSIEPIGSLGEFYTVFYTYGDDGFPEWYSDLGVFEQTGEDYWNVNSNRTDLIRYQYDYITKSASKNLDDAQKGFISHNKCSDDYGSIGINFNKKYNPIFFEYMDKVDWCSQANIAYEQRPNDNVSGLWWAGASDSGWGWSMSLQERADTTALVVVLYYYDGQGNPRWLLGVQEGFEFGQEINVDMNMFKGYARNATPVDLTKTPAGTMQFTINNPVGINTYTGTMSMDVNYPGAEGGHWQRENIAITRQSNVRR